MDKKMNTRKEVAVAITHDEKTYSFFIDLYYRWLDEWRYEDINDYIIAMKRSLDSLNMTIGRFKYSPTADMNFRFSIECEDGKMFMQPKEYTDGTTLVFLAE